jgi:hypothetical protein
VLLPAATLIAQVNERQYDGKVFVVYHSQDFLKSDLVTVDAAKISAFAAILQAFKNEQAAGRYRLMTFGGYHDAPPLPTPTPGADRIVYDDYLNVPWSDISWNATVNGNNTSPVFSGSRSLRVAETGWGALSVLSGIWTNIIPLDPTRYASVDFMIYTPTSGFVLGVQLENEASEPFPAVTVNVPANQWVSVSMSMASLAPSRRPFDRIDLFDANGTTRTYFVDSFRLKGLRAGGATPTPPLATPTPRPPTPTPTRSAPTATPTGPGPTPTPSSATAIIYGDSLRLPWIDASWSATVDYANTTPIFGGTRSIRVAETGWGGFSVHSGPWGQTQHVNPSGYASLQFRVYTTTSGFNVAVRLENDAKAAFPEIATGAIPTNQWVLVSIPMSQLNPAGALFDRIDIRDYTGTTRTYYLDGLQLNGK